MSAPDDQEATRRVRAREVGLFRYGLISEAIDPALSTKQRGWLVRAVAARTHPGPFGTPVQVSRASLDRWIRGYRTGGFAVLVPAPRRLAPHTPAEVLELAVALKREAPGRTAAQVAVVLAAHAGWAPSPRTLQRHFAACGLTRWRPDGAPPATFGRFEAERPNVRWVGDALHGPLVAGRKAILIAFLDDHARAVVAARWGHAETAVALRETLRVALAARGRPAQLLRRQRVDVHRRGAAAGLRGARHHVDPLPTGPARRPGQDRSLSGVNDLQVGVCAGSPLAVASARGQRAWPAVMAAAWPGGVGPRADPRDGWMRTFALPLLPGGVVPETAAQFEVLPVGGLQRVFEGGHLLAVTVFELGELGGQGGHHAAGLVGIGAGCRGRGRGLLLGP